MLISWNVTKECNLKCRHCYRDAGVKAPDELTTPEAKDLVDEISKSGFKIVILSGGEPLLREDIYEIISRIKSCGMRPVLGTNGLLIDSKTAEKLKNSGLARAGISLDSDQRMIHDDFRMQQGSWDKAIEAMRACKKAGLEFQVHTTLTRRNFAGIEKITDLAIELGAAAHHIFFLVPAGRGSKINDFEFLKSEHLNLLNRIFKKQESVSIELKPVCAPQFIRLGKEKNISTRFSRGCLAGISYCCVLPNGDIHPCPYLPEKAGNAKKDKFSKIWKESPVFLKMRSLVYGGNCMLCSFYDSCGGCRARAWEKTGDYMQEDPFCFYNNKATA